MKDLADRMKKYERIFQPQLCPRTPVIIRLDGRAFHTLTRNMNKPFDYNFIKTMIDSAGYVCSNIQGFKLAYVQSDEVNIVLTDYDNLDTQGWFDYNLSKIVSISAGMMSASFCRQLVKFVVFDSRAFNIPEEEVANYFLWREKDWTRNSLTMYARTFFSHNELKNKSAPEVHEMLYSIGKNWTVDLPEVAKNGTWIRRSKEKGTVGFTKEAFEKDGLEYTHHNHSTYDSIEELLDRQNWKNI